MFCLVNFNLIKNTERKKQNEKGIDCGIALHYVTACIFC